MESSDITVHSLTNDPTAAWKEISVAQNYSRLKIKNPSSSVPENNIRIVCMSDTHSQNENIKFTIPNGDILIVAGDFTKVGHESEVIQFNDWMKSLPHKHKLVICGNHELSFDKTCILFKSVYQKDFKYLLTDCTYLEDSGITLYGIKFYGSPWQPEFKKGAFNLRRGEKCLVKWNLIPEDVDVLITHGPPLGYGDLLNSGCHAGCVELLSTVQKRVRPKYHVFGHIHEVENNMDDLRKQCPV